MGASKLLGERAASRDGSRSVIIMSKDSSWLPTLQHETRRLTLKEMFSCSSGQAGITQTVVLRYAVVGIALVVSFATLFLWRVLLTEQSAIHHQCEHQYILWPMAIVFQCLFHAILLNYLFTESTFWAGWSDGIFFVSLSTALGWYFFVYFRMAHICLTFYTIKYPVLLASPHVCAPVSMLVWVSIVLRRLFVGYGENDPVIIFSLFYKANEHFVPRLFEKEKITAYKTGVNKWTGGVKSRNETLEEAFNHSVDIQNSTKNQSQLLSQMTQVVKDVGTKTRRVDTQLKKQADLLDGLQTAVNDAEDQLSGLSDKTASWQVGCSCSDYIKWGVISFMCCGIMLLSLLAVPKRLHLFGITLGINL